MAAKTKTGTRCKKTEQNPTGWKELTPQDISLNKPIVFCFPGDGTTNSKGANSIAKNAEEMLGMVGLEDSKKDIQIIAIYYDTPDEAELHDGRQHFLEENHIQGKSKKEFTENLITPPYIKHFYQDYIKPLISDNDGNRLDTTQAKTNLRSVNILAHCHGSYVASKLEEIMQKDMEQIGYSPEEKKEILKQMAIVSIAPRTNFEKNQSTQIAFAALDDYHFYDANVVITKNLYGLDDETVLESTTGVFAMPAVYNETKSEASQLYAVDKMLKFNSEDDAFRAQLGGVTEELHTVKAYTKPNFSCSLGHKSQAGKNFTNLIAKSLQNAVSNSYNNCNSDNFTEISKEIMLSDKKPSYKQGSIEQNKDYMNINLGNIIENAHKTGEEMERRGLLNAVRKIVKRDGVRDFKDPNLNAIVILDAAMHNLYCDIEIRKEDREKIDPQILDCIDRLQSSNTPLTKALTKKSVAKQYAEMSGIDVDTQALDEKIKPSKNIAPKNIKKSENQTIDKNNISVCWEELNNKSH